MTRSTEGRRRPPGRPLTGPGITGTVTVGVVDTVPLFRDGIAALIRRASWMRLVAYSASQHGAVHMAEQTRPDLVLIDSGLDPQHHLTYSLIGADASLRIVVLVREVHRNARYLSGALSAGAHAAVPRSAEPDRIIEALQHAQQRRRFLDPALAALVTERRGTNRAPSPRGEFGATRPIAPTSLPVSRREYQVLQLVAEGMENAAIAKSLFLSVETVRTHVKSILRKLSARDRTHAVTIAFRTGLLTLTPDDEQLPAAVPAAERL